MVIAPPPRIEFDHPTDYRDELRAHAHRVRVLVIPERRYLMIDGRGQPGPDTFPAAMATLYPVAYTLHFALKKHGLDAPVGALELVMWGAAPNWGWRLQLPVPEIAGDEDLAAAISDVRVRKTPERIDDLRVELWDEGLVAQILHVGPYAAEQPTIDVLSQAIDQRGLRSRGLHHEIYVSDPNRTAPERLKTIIRMPVEWA
jgi:hypothetical protein